MTSHDPTCTSKSAGLRSLLAVITNTTETNSIGMSLVDLTIRSPCLYLYTPVMVLDGMGYCRNTRVEAKCLQRSRLTCHFEPDLAIHEHRGVVRQAECVIPMITRFQRCTAMWANASPTPFIPMKRRNIIVSSRLVMSPQVSFHHQQTDSRSGHCN